MNEASVLAILQIIRMHPDWSILQVIDTCRGEGHAIAYGQAEGLIFRDREARLTIAQAMAVIFERSPALVAAQLFQSNPQWTILQLIDACHKKTAHITYEQAQWVMGIEDVPRDEPKLTTTQEVRRQIDRNNRRRFGPVRYSD